MPRFMRQNFFEYVPQLIEGNYKPVINSVTAWLGRAGTDRDLFDSGKRLLAIKDGAVKTALAAAHCRQLL